MDENCQRRDYPTLALLASSAQCEGFCPLQFSKCLAAMASLAEMAPLSVGIEAPGLPQLVASPFEMTYPAEMTPGFAWKLQPLIRT